MAAEKEQPQAPRVRECSTCMYWDNSLAGASPFPAGLCRKKAPEPAQMFNAVQQHQQTGIMFAPAVWPMTLAGENCGEHKFPVGATPKGAQA